MGRTRSRPPRHVREVGFWFSVNFNILSALHFISFHFISFHFISFRFVSFCFVSFHFVVTPCHFIPHLFLTLFHFISSLGLVSPSLRFISTSFIFNCVTFCFISFHCSELRRIALRCPALPVVLDLSRPPKIRSAKKAGKCGAYKQKTE